MIIKKHLPQIESLRALAVISVVFFHFEIFNFSGGFVGVDIFYVISGYLFTSIIISDLKNNKFTDTVFNDLGSHPNEHGHEIIAELLYKDITEKNLI